MGYELPDVPQDRWAWIAKAFGDYLLISRAHQSTQSRLNDKASWTFEQGQVAMSAALEPLATAKDAIWESLGTAGLEGFPFGDPWPDEVCGLSRSQVAFITGSYATCFLPSESDDGEVVEPMGVPGVAKAWAYHGLHVVDGSAPRYRKGDPAGFDRDIKAKLIHRVAGMTFRHDNRYRRTYERACEKKNEDPSWDCEAGESDGHRHAHGLRVTVKEIIKDWWRVLHGQPAHATRGRSQAGPQLRTAPAREAVTA